MKNGKHQHGWSVRSLGEAAEVTMGSSPPGESYNDEGKGVPLINGPVEFSEGDFGLTIRGKSTTEPTRMCRSGDLLLCVRGSTTGRTNIAGFDACIGRGVASIRAKEDQRFLNHFIRTQRQRLFDIGNGSTFPSITQEQLVSVQVPLPPLPEQRRIAVILDKADAIRRKREEGIRLTVELLRSAFLEMFGDPVKNPKGWIVKTLGELAEVQGGLQLFPTRRECPIKVPYLRVANVYRDRLLLDEVKKIDCTAAELERVRLRLGDILLVEGHGNREEIGRSAVWNGSIDPCVHQNHLIRVRSLPALADPTYLSAFLNSAGGRRQLVGFGKTTSGLNTISVSNVRGVEVLTPPIAMQREYASQVCKIKDVVHRRGQACIETTDLFASLVQRAFRGEL